MRFNGAGAVFTAVVLAGTLSACGKPAQDITKVLQVSDVTTGWFDAGVDNGKNKLVPTVSVKLKNATGDPVSIVQLNAVFRRKGETEEWGGAYVQVIGSEGLAPGASTRQVVLKSQLGYTGTEPRAKMLQNSQFLDASVQVFAKHGAAQWAKLGEWPIKRELLVQ